MVPNNTDALLRQLEFSIGDISRKYEGKQSSRVFANTVWMVDFIESRIKSQLNPLIKELENLQNTPDNTTIQNNAMISAKHIQEIQKLFDAILIPYKNNYDFAQIDSAWRTNLPLISEKIKSLRHRVDIINSSFSTKKKIEDEDWYSNL